MSADPTGTTHVPPAGQPPTWQWKDDDGYKDYTIDLCRRFEEALAAGKPIVDVDDQRFLDLKAMVQRRKDFPARQRAVRRLASQQQQRPPPITQQPQHHPSVSFSLPPKPPPTTHATTPVATPTTVAPISPPPPPPPPQTVDMTGVHWEWQELGVGFQPYDDATNRTIETAYQNKQHIVSIDNERFIDFDVMRQRRKDNPARMRKIRRSTTQQQSTAPTTHLSTPQHPPSPPSFPPPRPPSHSLAQPPTLQKPTFKPLKVFTNAPPQRQQAPPTTTKSSTPPPSDISNVELEDADVDDILQQMAAQVSRPPPRPIKQMTDFLVRPQLKTTTFGRNRAGLVFDREYFFVVGELPQDVAQQCKAQGAEFKNSFVGFVTKVIVADGVVTKRVITTATLRNIPIVSLQWVVQSLDAKEQLPTSSFQFDYNELERDIDRKRPETQSPDQNKKRLLFDMMDV